MIFNRAAIITFIICSLFITGVIGYNDYLDYNKSIFVADMESSQPGTSQIFYDAGRGYNEQNSHSIDIQRGNFQKYIFPLTGREIKSIRFDPINGPAVVRIKNARVENNYGDIIKIFALRDFRPIQQVAKMDIAEDTLAIHIEGNANDPIIQIENSAINKKVQWKEYIAKRGWIIIGYGLLSLLILTGLNYFVMFAARHEYIISMASRYRAAVFMGLLGVWGLILLILTPPFQAPDEFAHYNRAFQVSEFTMISVKQGDLLGGPLPQVLKFDQAKFNFFPFFANRKISCSHFLTMRAESPAMTLESLEKREFYDFANVALYPPFPYLFSGLGIAVARFCSMTVLNGFYMARLFNLLAAIGIIFCVMQLLRPLPELQLMLFLIAGMPMMTFELMSVSADCITFSFAVLVFACIVNLSIKWNRGVYFALAMSCVLLGLCKQVYALLPFISFIFWRSIPGSFFRKTGHIMLVIACAIVPMVVWSMYAQNIYVPHLKGVHIDPVAQMRYFIGNWHILTPHFLKNIFYENWRVNVHSMYGILGWLDAPLPRQDAALYIGLCFASVLLLLRRKAFWHTLTFRGNNDLEISIATRFLLLSFVLFSVFLIALSMYLSWNPVGVTSLEGIQGRYFIPLLPILLLAFYRLLPIRLSSSGYLSWAVLCLGVWAYFSWQAVWILRARYWVA
jgi:uncharacterized membrane protein